MSKTSSSAMKGMKKTMDVLHPWFDSNDVKLKLLRYLYPSTPTDLTRCVEHQCVKRKCVKSKKVNVELAGSGKVLCYGFDLSKVHTFVDLKQQLHKLLPKYNRDLCDPKGTMLFTSQKGTKKVKSLRQARDCNLLVLQQTVESVKSRVESLLKEVKESGNYEKDVLESFETFLRMCLYSESGRTHMSHHCDVFLKALRVLKMNQSVFEFEKFQDLLKEQQEGYEEFKYNCSYCGNVVSSKFLENFDVHECRKHCRKCLHCGRPKTRDMKVYLELLKGDNLRYQFENLSLMTTCSSFCEDYGDYSQCDDCGKMVLNGECPDCYHY